MNYKIIVDSCGELTEEMRASGNFETASLFIELDGECIVDDETFDQADFLARMARSKEGARSSCPSPETYLNALHCSAESIYAVTLSAKLSGSYNSAMLGKQLYEETYGRKRIHVFNSRTASVGETLIALKIQSCVQAGLPYPEVVRTVEAYIKSQRTYFVLESLEMLRKSGRLSGAKALLAGALNIKPVMGATKEGGICKLAQERGMKRAIRRMAAEVVQGLSDAKQRILGISHCHCPERAAFVRDMLLKMADFKDVILVDTGAISSMYASDGGIIVCV